jgi:hypothetical protein
MLVLGSLLFAILLGECALRVLGVQSPVKRFTGQYSVHEMSPNLKLLYKLRPNASNPAHGVLNKINSGGFRDNEYPVQKDPAKYRILFLGDSVVYGYGLSLADTLPKQLEDVFRKNSGASEVLNFGVSGYETEQEIEFLKENGLKYHPDMVIVGYTLNDSRYGSMELDKLSELPGNNVCETGTDSFKNALTFLYDHSRFLSFLDERLHIQRKVKELKSNRSPIRRYIADKNKAIRDPVNSEYRNLEASVVADAQKLGASDSDLKNALEMTGLRTAGDIGLSHWNVSKNAFLEFQKLSQKYHFKAVVVIFPYFKVLARYPLASVHFFLRDQFHSMGFSTIDLLGHCQGLTAEEQCNLSLEGIHFTPWGSSNAANYIYDEISRADIKNDIKGVRNG